MATDIKEVRVMENFFGALECPVCYEVLTAPIPQCTEGHSICLNCRRKISKCPICKCKFSRSRNFSLELLTENIAFPCKNSEHGCIETSSLSDIKCHEDVCPYRQYECLAGNESICPWRGQKSDILPHVMKVHGEYFWTGAENLDLCASGDFSFDGTATSVISAYDEIFWVKVCRDSVKESRYLSVHYIGPEQHCTKYFYEVSYVSKFTPQKLICCIQTHPDYEEIDDLIKKNQCSILHKEMAKHFIENDTLKYGVKIFQV